MSRFARNLVWLGILVIFAADIQAEIAITDSHGKHRFDQPPERIVSLSWALTEQLLELGVTPLGIADLKQFRNLSTRYQLSTEVQDLGPRIAPDLAKIKALKPQVILIGYSQRSLLRPLSNIARVIYFNNFGRRYDNASKADERFLELASLFEKTELAANKLRARDERLAELKTMLEKVVVTTSLAVYVPPTTAKGRYNVFVDNSLPHSAAQQLGFTVVQAEKADKYGVVQLTAKELLERILVDRPEVDDSEADSDVPSNAGPHSSGKGLAANRFCSIVFDRLNHTQNDDQYRSINTVTPSCTIQPSYQMPFGGAMSVLWLAESIADEFKR